MPGAEPGAAEAGAAVAELRILVHRLSDEVAAFRRRAMQAEGRVRELEQALDAERAQRALAAADGAGEGDAAPDPAQLAALERENADLRQRLTQAAERTRQLLERARFLRQQQGDTPA